MNLDFSDTERTPLLQNVITESRQYTANVDHMNTFFTPVDSPTHSDDEDTSKKQEDSRRLSKSSELSIFLANLTPNKVSEIKFFYLLIIDSNID